MFYLNKRETQKERERERERERESLCHSSFHVSYNFSDLSDNVDRCFSTNRYCSSNIDTE